MFDVWRKSQGIDSNISVFVWVMGIAYIHDPKAPASLPGRTRLQGHDIPEGEGQSVCQGGTHAVNGPHGFVRNTLGTVPVRKPQSLRVIIDGKEVGASDLQRDEAVTIWVPQSMFDAQPAAAGH
jgi:hypothetical protein